MEIPQVSLKHLCQINLLELKNELSEKIIDKVC